MIVERNRASAGAATAGPKKPHPLRGAAGVQPHRCGFGRNVSALDVSVQAQIVNLLEEPKQRRSLAMLFVSHDLAVKYLSGWIAVIDLGRVMEIGPSLRVVCPAPPLHRGADFGRAGRRRKPQTHHSPGRRSEPGRSAVRLRLPHALPLRAAGLRGRSPDAARSRIGALEGLPPRRRADGWLIHVVRLRIHHGLDGIPRSAL